ncbi:MAG: hypothetical protein K2M55_09360 [Muribaculaceae bacterium]|nr:hypothetical protein [Muribaculaceae bacterium]
MTKKHLLLLLACVFAFGIPSMKASTFYSKVTATVSSGEGYVYVANADKTDVSDDEINQTTHSATYSGQGLGTTGRGEPDHTFKIYAKGADGYSFKQWTDGNKDNPRTVSFTVSSTSSSSPTTKEYAAIFEGSAFSVKSYDLSMGTVSIDKPIVNIGDVVTITATPIKPVGNGELWGTTTNSKSVKFAGWYNKAGDFVSDENPYKHTVDAEDVFTAKFEREFAIKTDANNKIYGYYRLQSTMCNNPNKEGEPGKYYMCITGDFVPALSSSNRYLMGAVELNQYPYDFAGARKSDYAYSLAPYSDCGSVLYITGDAESNIHSAITSRTTVANNIDATAQGVSVKKMTGGQTLNLKTAATQGFYIIFSGSSASLQVNYFHHMWVTTDKPANAVFNYAGDFDVQPIDLEHIDTNYFGAYPSADMEFDGGYWSTMYTSFPYECYEPDGVEAYVVKSATNNEEGTFINLTRLEDGIVPAATPVILKCKGLTPKENRLLPLMPDDARLADAKALCEGNLLTGNYGLWTGYSNTTTGGQSQTATYSGRPTYNQNTMRVFNVNASGNLGFYRMAMNEDGSAPELVPNRAYLTDAALAAAGITPENAARGIRMRFDSELGGIEDVTVEPTNGDAVIYDLYGRRVTRMVSGNIYIVNGRKVYYRD